MNANTGYALLSVSMVGLLAFAGILSLTMSKRALRFVVESLVALAAGAMLGNALLHLLPESFEHGMSAASVAEYIGAGFLGCFLLVKLVNFAGGGAHHCGDEPLLDEDTVGEQKPLKDIHSSGFISLISHAVDNFSDGALIAVSYLASFELGIATTIAVILHETPMEFGGFGVLVRSGFSIRNAVLINVGSACIALLGACTVLFTGLNVEQAGWLTPVACGVMLYNSAVGLMPQLLKNSTWKTTLIQTSLVVAGFGIMALLRLVG